MAATFVQVCFDHEADKKHSVRFKEDAKPGEEVLRTLYVSKAALATLGNPTKLVIRIEKGAAEQTSRRGRGAPKPSDAVES